MTRPTRNSAQINNTKNRLIGFTTIDPNLDLGNGLSVQKLSQLTSDLQAQLNEYNSTIVRLDQMGSQIQDLEKAIAHLSGKMLTAVGLTYGYDSEQYQMAGGKKRKRNAAVTQTLSAPTLPVIESINLVKNTNGNGKKAIAL
jgi:outer membrane murein-binding lipoprotein Lpp